MKNTKFSQFSGLVGFNKNDYSEQVMEGNTGGGGYFSFFHCTQTISGAHMVSYPMGTKAPFSGIKQPHCENTPT
jgi:hypothetical protein